MNTNQTTLPKPEDVLKEMLASGEIDYGTITDGLCATPDSQAEFDKDQKNKPPITE